MRELLLTGTLWLVCLMCFSSVTHAQEAATGHTALSAAERADALKTIEETFQKLYVFPEMRPKIIEMLGRRQKAGYYDVSDPTVFAYRITEDLRDVAHDKHLALVVDPAAYAAAMAPPESDLGEESFLRRRAVRDHHGLTEMKILPGNIRYLKIARFEWVPDETGAIYDSAMRFLKDGDAWIIDLRGNGGGDSAAPHYLISHFLDPGTLDYTFFSGSNTPQQSLALDYLPAGRLKGKPLYVLIDGGVGSAAESVAYDVQQFKLGELVGAKTVGAANNNRLLPIAPNFILSISYGHPVHAVSNSNWEGVGVRPTVECPPVQALDLAQSLALSRLALTPHIAPEIMAEYTWARVPVEARLHPVTLTQERLTALTGHYGKPNAGFGEANVELSEGVLWLKRPNSPPTRLLPLTSEGLFAIEGNDLLRARLTGRALELLWWDDPNPRVFARN